MKEPLKSCHICLSGDFGTARSHDALKKWITVNGGKVCKSVTAKTTHLVCSKKHWKGQSPGVQAALQHEGIKIVSYDWLEDSLHHRVCRSPRRYLWSVLAKNDKVRKREQKSEREVRLKRAIREFKAGCEAAAKDLLSDNHHFYRDSTGFVYNIILFRSDIEKNLNERHRLSLYESNHGPPHLYACTSTYHVPGKKEVSHILTPTGSQYTSAFTAWRRFFKSKTGVDWDFRFHGRQTQELKPHERIELRALGGAEPVGAVEELSHEEKEKGERKNYYIYKLPDGEKGEPMGEVGLMRQAIELFGEVPEDLERVGGMAVESEGSETE